MACRICEGTADPCVVCGLSARLAQVTEERDRAVDQLELVRNLKDGYKARAEAAEDEVEQLRGRVAYLSKAAEVSKCDWEAAYETSRIKAGQIEKDGVRISALEAENSRLGGALQEIAERHRDGPTNHAEGSVWSDQTYRWAIAALSPPTKPEEK